jgi:acetyltransferase-like isoleucine patch superfamily enzyme
MALSGARVRKAPWKLRYEVGGKLASDLRKLSVRVTHLHCRVEFQGPVWLGPGFSLNIPDRGTLIVGPGVLFRRGFVCEIAGNGRVRIGAGTVFTNHTMLGCTTTMDIGKRCLFGQSTLIMDGFHKFRDPDKHMLDQGYDYRPITIGDGAAIAAKCSITADIGERSFIGSNSVVSRPIPPYCFAVGAPAKVIEYFGHPDKRPPELVGMDV